VISTACEGCKWHGISRVYRESGACYRRKAFTDGTIRRPPSDGFSTEIGTGNIHLIDSRVEADHCGPDRRNYVARAV
jgi:hypothetical protein